MREIKFRAYLKQYKKIVDVKSIHLGTKKIIVGFSKSKTNYGNYSVNFDDIELMQYTGLKDKNGKEIYEGDILKFKMYNGQYENYQIVFREAEFEAINKDDTNFISSNVWNKDGEIIGNIYDNPDLLEE